MISLDANMRIRLVYCDHQEKGKGLDLASFDGGNMEQCGSPNIGEHSQMGIFFSFQVYMSTGSCPFCTQPCLSHMNTFRTQVKQLLSRSSTNSLSWPCSCSPLCEQCMPTSVSSSTGATQCPYCQPESSLGLEISPLLGQDFHLGFHLGFS